MKAPNTVPKALGSMKENNRRLEARILIKKGVVLNNQVGVLGECLDVPMGTNSGKGALDSRWKVFFNN